MITDEHKKELFSCAYLGAISARSGANFSSSSGAFDYGIDVEFKQVISRSARDKFKSKQRLCSSGIEFHAQVKCTENLRNLITDEAHFSYDLDPDNYNDLVIDGGLSAVKKILIVVAVPSNESERLEIIDDKEKMILKNLAYWVNLMGMDGTQNSSQIAVRIPKKNIFSHETITTFFKLVREGKKLEI